VISVGSFADPAFPPPTESGYNSRRHEWLDLPEGIAAFAPELWWPIHPHYQSGRYEEAADRGRELLDTHPQHPDIAYNVACCESLAGRSADAIEHLRLAIDGHEYFRAMAGDDSDFDPIRDEPAFKELVR
jgi:tetratricopeptide (TPR) repeat protein